MAARTSRSRSKRIAAQREQHPQNPPRSSPSASVSSVRSPTAASVGGGTAGGATSPGADSVVSGLPESRDVTPAPTSTPTPKVGSSSELVAAGEDEEPGTPTRGRQETPKPVDSFAEVGATTQEEEGAEPLAEEHVQPAAGPEPQALVDVPEADPASVPASATADVDIEALPEEPVASASNAEARAPNGIEEHVDPSPSLPTEEPALDPADPAVDEPPEDPPATEVEPLSATVPVDTTDAPPDPAPVDSAPDPLPPASSLLVDDAAPATQPDSTERLSPAEPLEPTQELPSAFSIPASASSFPTSPPSFPDLPTTAVDPVLGRRPDFAYHDVPVGESLPFALESQQLADGGKADMGLGKEDWEVIGDEDVAEAAGADEREAGPSAEAMQDEGEGATVEGTQGEETSMNVDAEPPAVVDAALPEPPVPAAAASPVTETAQPDAAPLAVEDEAMTGIEGDAAAQPEDLPVEVGASQEEAQVVAAPEGEFHNARRVVLTMLTAPTSCCARRRFRSRLSGCLQSRSRPVRRRHSSIRRRGCFREAGLAYRCRGRGEYRCGGSWHFSGRGTCLGTCTIGVDTSGYLFPHRRRRAGKYRGGASPAQRWRME